MRFIFIARRDGYISPFLGSVSYDLLSEDYLVKVTVLSNFICTQPRFVSRKVAQNLSTKADAQVNLGEEGVKLELIVQHFLVLNSS